MSRGITKLLQLIAFGSGIATLFGFATGWSTVAPADLRPTVWTLLGITCASFISLFWVQARYSRRARYAEVLASIQESARLLNGLALNTADECQLAIDRIMDELAEAFSIVTSRRCAVWLKRISSGPQPTDYLKYRLHDVARDKKSKWRSKLFNTSRSEHLLGENSHLLHLFRNTGEPQGRCFFSNNLPSNKQYRSSGFAVYGEASWGDTPWPKKLFSTLTGWVLPYRSQIVVPVMSRTDGKPLICGYLSVDSASKNIFDWRYDVTLLEVFADILQLPLQKLNTVIQEQKEMSDAELQHDRTPHEKP